MHNLSRENEFYLHENENPYQSLSTYPRFETEAQGNPEMAYSKGLYQSSGKEKESCCLEFPSSTKREIRHFQVVVVQLRAKKCTKKRAKLLFCYYKPVAFFAVLVAVAVVFA